MSAVGTDNIDSDGWKIPRPGTKSRRIYDLLWRGYTHRQIQSEVGGSLNSIRVLIWCMRHHETYDAKRREYRRP